MLFILWLFHGRTSTRRIDIRECAGRNGAVFTRKNGTEILGESRSPGAARRSVSEAFVKMTTFYDSPTPWFNQREEDFVWG